MQKYQETKTTQYDMTKYKCNKIQMPQNTNKQDTNVTKYKCNKIQIKQNTKVTKYK